GARDLGIFTPGAIDQIAKHSGGIPRLINILCDHCLVIGYADQKRLIEPDVVDEACAYLGNVTSRRRALLRRLRTLRRRLIVGIVASLVVAGIGMVGYLLDIGRMARALIR